MPTHRDPETGRYAKPADSNGQAAIENALFKLIANQVMSRSQLGDSLKDPRRDIDEECGYPKTAGITTQAYRDLYDRESVARRVVEVLPAESWKVQPSIYETEDVDNETPFEKAWDELSKSLRGESWYQDPEGSPIWEHLRRADELSGIGCYGVLLLGLADGQDLKEPAEKKADQKLLFLRAFDQSLAEITQLETDVNNPRYGLPLMYRLSFTDPTVVAQSNTALASKSLDVHWTRVIHLADNLGASEVWGTPRQQPVYNRLFDLRKLYAGSAEMYWRGAFPGYSLESHPQLGANVRFNTADVRAAMEKYMTGLQRYLSFGGGSVKSLAPQVVDPTPQINTQLEAICIQIAVPKRVFVGSERGELASSQDTKAWNGRLQDRQMGYLTPRVIVPFVDRLIWLGVLPEPAEGYSAVWPDLDALTDQEQADIAVKRTEAMAKYVQGDVEALMPPLDFLTRILGLTQEEAQAVLEAALEAIPLDKEEDEDAEETQIPAKPGEGGQAEEAV